MTAKTDEDLDMVQHAETLDEATLRRVFPDAPTDIGVPRDTGALLKLRLRRLRSQHQTAFYAVLAIAALAIIASLAAGSPVGAIVVAAIVLIAALIVVGVQHHRAGDDFFKRYAQARGLQLRDDKPSVHQLVPLLGRGDKREYERYLEGTIAGQRSALAHYTYTEESTDSEGRRTETDYDFTVLQYRLPPAVAARFTGIYLSRRKLSFGALQDKLAHDHKVELESADFRKRYTLRAADTQDEVALYELFSTSFIDKLATELDINWEQVGGTLVVYRKGHENEAADLDLFCLESWHVLQRYLEEYQ